MTFHLGKPILAMLVISLLSGAYVLFRPAPKRADLKLWTFADSHYKAFDGILATNPRPTGKSVSLDLIQARALGVRMESSFMSGVATSELPDLVELEISRVGPFFRPPVDEMGLLPLNDRLKQSGWYDKIVKTRFAPWSKQGVIFGVPHDVHPVVVAYRDDLFREAGIDLSTAKTWPQFQQYGEQFQNYWRVHGNYQRHAIELASRTSDQLVVLLLQRGINLVDDFNRIHINEPKVAQTVAWYVRAVAGQHDIHAEFAGVAAGAGAFARDLMDGNIAAMLAPDWRVAYMRGYAPSVSGKMRLMALPVFDASDAPTSTWGGTMIGIPRACPQPDEAWKLLSVFYFSREGIEARRKFTDILPPVKTMWSDPYYHRADPFFGGQQIQALFIDLAEKIPARYVTPATNVAAALTFVQNRAIADVNAPDLEARCQGWLNIAADELQKRIDQWSFDEVAKPDTSPARATP